MRRVAALLKELVFEAYGSALRPSTEALLLSEPADGGGRSHDQSLHTDGDTTTPEADAHAAVLTPTTPPSLSVLVSFQDATVSVVRGSHRAVRKMSADEAFKPSRTMRAATVGIPKSHALFFTQDLVHAGDGYARDNLRYASTLPPLSVSLASSRRHRCAGNSLSFDSTSMASAGRRR